MKIQKKIVVKFARAALEAVTELFYPPRCPVCDELLLPEGSTPGRTRVSGGIQRYKMCLPEKKETNREAASEYRVRKEVYEIENGICTSCRKKIIRIAEPVCKKCGKPLSDERKEYCGDCVRKHHSYRQGKAVFLYKGEMRQSMYRFKYNNRREYASFFAAEAAAQYAGWIRRRKIEAIVPVPMYPGKKCRRGYNQAEVFARALGRKLEIPVETKLVKRIRDTTPQKELNDSERRKNLQNAFQVMTQNIQYHQLLLVDDIYTTGSTMDAVTEVLLLAGVKNIYYICISIGQGS